MTIAPFLKRFELYIQARRLKLVMHGTTKVDMQPKLRPLFIPATYLNMLKCKVRFVGWSADWKSGPIHSHAHVQTCSSVMTPPPHKSYPNGKLQARTNR